MRTAFAVLLSLSLLAVLPVDAQVTVDYQPTPYPLKRNYDGGSMPQDLNIVHLYDGWINNSYNTTLVRDGRLQTGGWGDTYETYIKFDLAGLPVNPTQVVLWLKSFSRGDSSTTVPFGLCELGSPQWDTTLTWLTLPSAVTCAGWFTPPTPGNWWGIDFTPWYAQWENGTVTNNGIATIPQSNNNQFDMFESSRYTFVTNRPILEFTFTPPTGIPNFKMPLPAGYSWLVTTEIGGYDCLDANPTYWPDSAHAGNNYYTIDISASNQKDGGGSYSGSIPVLAAAHGTVVAVGGCSTCDTGYFITLDHGYGYQTRYLHFAQPAARHNGTPFAVGDVVNQGDQLGIMGSTGASSGTHVHVNFWYYGYGRITDTNLSYVVMDGLLLKSYQTECAVNSSGVPTTWIRYYHSSNTPTGN
ncbi:MAG TPA: peptidoglycan DD-metalloendopeptidase family protein [Candidatus Paceibacterota bacterium]|jgi:hypothetical protein|nr:peptidoglycan DD-metalloendopeptidase family protein [Candidatus Paceibacterota bacterium]